MSAESEASSPVRGGLERGVYRTSWGNRWFAQIRRAGKLHYLGTYPSPEEAAEAYRRAESLLG